MADDTQTNPPLAQTEPTESTDASLPSSLLYQLPQFQKTEEESPVEPPAEPPAENPESTPPPPPPPKKSSSKILVGLLLFFLLAGGLLAGFFGVQQTQEIRKKAYTLITSPPTDICGLIHVTVNELPSCPLLTNDINNTNPGQNQISTYTTTFTMTNVTNSRHAVHYVKNTNYCTEPLGQQQPGQGQLVCWSNPIAEPVDVTLAPNQTISITLTRSSPSGQACGSFQTDLAIDSIDNNTNCRSQITVGAPSASGLCQTGIVCQPTPTSTPTPPVTPSTTPTPTLTPTGTPTPTATTTPTPTPTITPTPTPRAGCNDNCTSDSSCLSGLTCSSGFCRNPSCTGSTNCTCTLPTPTPEIPVSGSGPSVLGASTIVGGILLLLLGLAL